MNQPKKEEKMSIQIKNNGQEIINSNWNHDKFYISINKGCVRLLWNKNEMGMLDDIMNNIKSTKIIVSQTKKDTEILFDDRTQYPNVIITPNLGVDRLLPNYDSGKELDFAIYMYGGYYILDMKCYFRRVKKIPCMKTW